MKKLIVSLSSVVLLAASIGFSITTPRAQKAPGDRQPRTAVVYCAFFDMVVDLENQALELESEGVKGETRRDIRLCE